jgi:hypothetical protein
MTYWNDFNNAEQSGYDLIPSGTIAKVKLNIKPGGYNDETQGWVDGYATKSLKTGAIYLDAEFMILEGKYAKRKVWSLIGLHSSKGPEWESMGKYFIKSMINSAKGISPKDNTEAAVAARSITKFAAIEGLEFVARIDVTNDENGHLKNEIKKVITPEHKDYAVVMTGANSQYSQQSFNNSNRSNWA